MKKILFAALAALAITSCTQNEEIEAPSQKSEIDFSTAVNRSTRAALTDNTNFKAFTVNAYSHAETFTGTITSTIISNGAFTGSGDTWTSTNKYYWPTSEKVTFFGYAPETATFTKESEKYPTLAYTVLDDIATQEDLVAAQTPNATKTDKVALAFKHILTQINFELKGTDTNVTYNVTKIIIKDVIKDGVFTYGSTPDNSFGSWEAGTTKIASPYTINLTNCTFTGEATATPLTAADQILILMPQDLSGIGIDVTYTATKGGVEICNTTKNISFTEGTWNPGQKITYTLKLAPGDEISLSGSVSDNWTPKNEEK